MSRSGPGILFISHDSGRTGAPIGLLAFMQWLRANTAYRIGTVLRNPGPLEPSFQALGPTLTLNTSILARTRLGRRVRQRLPASVREETDKIRKFFAAGSYDLIYSNTITNGLVLEALASCGVPVVTHVHELAYWISRTGPENLRRVVDRTTAFIAVAQAVRDNLVQNHQIPAAKITVIYEHIRGLPPIPSAAEKVDARQALGIPEGALVVGGCGAEHWRKGRDLIPQLLIALRRQRSPREIHFVWVGRPGNAEEESALRYDLRSAGVETLFHQSGEVANPFKLFPSIDVFALLSRDDPYPLACLEVAALQTPVVCFAGAGGMPEFCRDGCGLVAPYLDLEAMARDIVGLAADPARAQDSGRRARAKVARENLVEATAPQLLAVIDRLLGRGKGARAGHARS
ncbi:MAG: glycosyltransferase family 4 protein [Verrucomicrobia bacterium]|nr:glycosyltransferase family 4 protein [Verrucomicrobiota bacterium]